MLTVEVHASSSSGFCLLLSLASWLCICRWGFRYEMRDQEVIKLFVVNTLRL